MGVAALPVSRKVKLGGGGVVVSPLELLSPASTNNEGRGGQGVTSQGSDRCFAWVEDSWVLVSALGKT